jgi:hypothetical protein
LLELKLLCIKKFEKLGKVLSKEEQKKFKGGTEEPPLDCNTYWCSSNSDCLTKKCGDRCSSFNGNNRCWWNPF